ncbi:NAD(P)-dependent oxidoreductase [Brevibacillus brevis]|uniref:NAD(P)-dependent oxidoreductase n=1 Tax=Brevibacillus brevis TaxID=1393 RepID=A0ABY9T6I0_BREBE|nr:NAD(P)-dependent oxidoreductase [Brevibacillus brevis]WNC15467.1 NAD(P)-dependent oxidoreductase [Brevibacillus brevis]
MKKPKVFISHWMPAIGVDMIRQHCEVDYYDGTVPLDKREFIARAADADALLVFVPDVIDAEILDHCPKVKVISSFGKGYDNIDVGACSRRGILVTINPDALTDSTADLAIGLLLALSRNILPGDAHVRRKAFAGWHATNLLGKDFHHSTLGIIGMGAIGEAIAARAKGFQTEMWYTDVQRFPEKEEKWGIRYTDLQSLLEQSDFVIVAVNLVPETYHLIGGDQLQRMKPGSCLINISRGSTVDEAAVARSLQAGHLGGYASDVFAFEDPSNPHRPGYIAEELLSRQTDTVFTPHIGTGTLQARDRLAVSSANQLLAALKGDRPTGAVNFQQVKELA